MRSSIPHPELGGRGYRNSLTGTYTMKSFTLHLKTLDLGKYVAYALSYRITNPPWVGAEYHERTSTSQIDGIANML